MKYLISYRRREIGTLNSDEEYPIAQAEALLREAGCETHPGSGHWSIFRGKEVVYMSYAEVPPVSMVINLLFRGEFIFSVRADENSHTRPPSVFADWCEDTIEVDLDDLTYRGEVHTPAQAEKAVRIIRRHKAEFRKAWELIVLKHDTEQARALFEKE